MVAVPHGTPDLSALIARLEEAKGPSPDLDAEIAAACPLHCGPQGSDVDMTTPVLFLDMDGVILAGRHWKAKRRERIPADTMALLNEAVARSGAQVVVSSVWRADNRLREKLKRAGFKGQFHSEWRTPEIRRPMAAGSSIMLGARRGDEINDWLCRHRSVSFCIVDDDSDMLDEQKPFFVQTKFEDGLTQAHVEAIVAIFHRQAT